MTWTHDRIDPLKRLWAEGVSAELIAGRLGEGVTRNAVIGKVHRLELKVRRVVEGQSRRPGLNRQRPIPPSLPPPRYAGFPPARSRPWIIVDVTRETMGDPAPGRSALDR